MALNMHKIVNENVGNFDRVVGGAEKESEIL